MTLMKKSILKGRISHEGKEREPVIADPAVAGPGAGPAGIRLPPTGTESEGVQQPSYNLEETLLSLRLVEVSAPGASSSVHDAPSSDGNYGLFEFLDSGTPEAQAAALQLTVPQKAPALLAGMTGNYQESEPVEQSQHDDDESYVQQQQSSNSHLHNPSTSKDAEAVFKRRLAHLELTIGPNSLPTLSTIHDLGEYYLRRYRLDEAEAMYSRALQGRESKLGADNVSTLKSVDGLGHCYLMQDRLDMGEAMLKRSLQGMKLQLGADNALTLATVDSLGHCYTKQNRLDEAEAMLKDALQRKESKFGPHTRSALSSARFLGICHIEQNRLDEAEAMLKRALRGRKSKSGRDNTSTLITVEHLCHCYVKQNRLDEAEAMLKRALHGRELKHSRNDLRTIKTVSNLAHVYFEQGLLEEAERLLRRALTCFDGVRGSQAQCNGLRASIIGSLATVCSRQGRTLEAKTLEQLSLAGLSARETGPGG